MEKPDSASSFPETETAPHHSGIIFREENEAKVPPGAAFGDPLCAAGEGYKEDAGVGRLRPYKNPR